MKPSPSDKQTLRQQAMERRQALSDTERDDFSRHISQQLHTLLETHFPHISTLLCYVSMQHEVDTRYILAWPNYRFAVPRVHEHTQMQWLKISHQTRWKCSPWGVQEPINGEAWLPADGGILLCPLTAFDRTGNRLGMGKGCFDLWLSRHRQYLTTIIGLAFSCQEVPHVPVEPHDIPMQFVVTEKESIACPS